MEYWQTASAPTDGKPQFLLRQGGCNEAVLISPFKKRLTTPKEMALVRTVIEHVRTVSTTRSVWIDRKGRIVPALIEGDQIHRRLQDNASLTVEVDAGAESPA